MNDVSNKREQRLTLVLGHHRSGSSITTKLLQSLGCELGHELLGGSKTSNPIGHFENLKVLNFHEELLQRANTDWQDPNPLAKNKFIQENKVVIEESIKELLSKLLITEQITALKEPRTSILLDLWSPALNEYPGRINVVLTVRHPSEVAASLARRDGLNIIAGLHLWIAAMLNGIRYAREVPNHFLFYSRLIDNPELVANELGKFMELAESTSIDLSDINGEYRHYDFLSEGGSPSKLASEIFVYVSGQKQASFVNFPDSLLNDWENRLQISFEDLNRYELIKLDTQQRDELTQQRDELTQQRDELTQQRDELTQQRDDLTQQRDAILNSTIWRATRPIRWFVSQFKR
jgi:hypothetical protein